MNTSDFTFSQKGYKVTVNDCTLGELHGEEIHSSGIIEYVLQGRINWFGDDIVLHIFTHTHQLEESLHILRTVYLDRYTIYPKIKDYCITELEIFRKECEQESEPPIILADFINNIQVQSLNIFLSQELEINFLYDKAFYVSTYFDVYGNCHDFDCDIYIG